MDSTQYSFSWENFHGALHLQDVNNTITVSLYNIHGKTFAVLLKTAKGWPNKSFPIYGILSCYIQSFWTTY